MAQSQATLFLIIMPRTTLLTLMHLML
jgi:hypothetical protein